MTLTRGDTIDNLREKSIRELSVGSTRYKYYSLAALRESGFERIDALPVSIKILLENLLRHCDDDVVRRWHIV